MSIVLYFMIFPRSIPVFLEEIRETDEPSETAEKSPFLKKRRQLPTIWLIWELVERY